MVSLGALWIPILVSAVIVFVASSIIHMALPWHKGEYPKVPAERSVMDALRPFALPPGDYMIPRASDMKEMKTPQFQERMRQGPVIVMTVRPNGPWNVGGSLLQWFIYSIVVSIFAGYAGGSALPAGADYLRVFQIVGTTAIVGYSLALPQLSIWYGRGWGLTIRSAIDGVIYGALTAGTFGWLWPTAQ
jgi:hypothetical protein